MTAKSKLELIIHGILAFIFAVLFFVLERYRHSVDKLLEERPRTAVILWSLLWLGAVLIAWYFLNKLVPIGKWVRTYITKFLISQSTTWHYSSLARMWGKNTRQGRDPSLWYMRRSIAHEYLHQEIEDLSGHGDLLNRGYTDHDLEEWRERHHPREGRPLIITNFVRYARLVGAIVNVALKRRVRRSQIVLCITTLNMPLEKWFNFDDKAHCIHSQWDNYLTFLQHLVGRQNVLLARVLLVRPADKSSNNRIALRTAEELKSDLRSWIWLQKRTTATDYNVPLPLDLKGLRPIERQAIFNKLETLFPNNADVTARRTYYGDPDRSAYVIFPEGVLTDPPTNVVEGGFAPLGQEFLSRFHSKFSNGTAHHAYYAEVDPKDFIPVFTSPFPPPPSDLFYVGLLDPDAIREQDMMSLKALKQNAKSLFYIAARTDEAIHHVAYLSLLDQGHCPDNFAEVERYLNGLVERSQALSSLL